MNTEFLGARRQALENLFFSRSDQKLLDKLRQQVSDEKRKQQLASACGVHQEAILNQLIAWEISPETAAALTLAPLVMVAWADNKMEARERQAILQAAEANGVETDSPAHQLLSQWIEIPPGDDFKTVWTQYAQALTEGMGGGEQSALRETVLGGARQVAEAAGGILGWGNKISAKEQAILDELEAALR